MTATARRARKNIREDRLVTTTVRVSEWAQEHFNQVIIGVVALVAVVAVLVFAANSRSSSAREAERQMGAALVMFQRGDMNAARSAFEQIYQRHGGAQATAARYFKGKCDLQLGHYQEALSAFDAYLADSDDYPMFQGAAHIGKGLCYEGLQNWGEAAAAMVAALAVLDRTDPRYYQTAYRAGEFYKMDDKLPEARKHFEMVADGASGELAERARLSVSLLGQ